MGEMDAAYRRLFQHKEILRDLMACVLSPALFASLEWERMQPVPTSHVGDRLQQRAGDCAWLIPWITKSLRASAPGLCILLLFEQQTRPDNTMALRIVSYAGLSYQTLLRHDLVFLPLPPVLPVVLYSGDARWTSALSMAELLDEVPADLAPYQPQMRYLLVDERKLLEGAQLPDCNLAALMLRLARSRDVEQWRDLLHTLIEVVRGPGHEELNRSLTAWLQYVARGDDSPARELPQVKSLQELDMMIAEKPGIWAQHWRREGQAEGRVEGQADLLLRQLQRRFGPVSEEIEQRVRTANAEQLEAWSLDILDAATLDDVFRS